MPINRKFDYLLLDIIESAARNAKASPLNLGGVGGEDGGTGGPPGGFIGQLKQKKVAYDTTEAETLFTPLSGMSLVDNLNHIRYRVRHLENTVESGIIVVDEWDGSPTVYPVNHITFSGATVMDLGDGHVLVTMSGGGGGTALTVEEFDGSPIVGNVDRIIFSGPSVYDLGNGDVLVAFSGTDGTRIIIEDLTGQVPDTHFDLASTAESGTLRLYYNGIRQPPDTYYSMDPDGQGFTTEFTTYSGDAVVVDYNETNGVTETIFHEFGVIAVDGEDDIVAGVPEETLTVEAGAHTEITTDSTLKKLIISQVPNRTRTLPLVSDFLEANENETGFTVLSQLVFTPISNGTFGSYTGSANHPGWVGFNCGTNANSGAMLQGNLNAIIEAGSSFFECIFYVTQSTNLVLYMGMHRAISATAPSDGVWFNVAGTTLTGKFATGGSTSTTGTSHTISTATWYRCRFETNSDAGGTFFALYDESGTLLWSEALISGNMPTTNIPAVNVVAAKTTVSGAGTEIVRADWVAYWSSKVLTR